MKHSPEPWILLPNGEIVDGKFSKLRETEDYSPDSFSNEMNDFERIITCVNACAGIENPQEAIGAAREMLERCSLIFTLLPPSGLGGWNWKHLANECGSALAKLQPKV